MHDYFASLLERDQFYLRPDCCTLLRKKGYYSRDRGAHITFDLAIEVRLSGHTDYSMLLLIECKNYSHPVSVDDVEEFHSKIQQVAGANVKGILATATPLQSGALAFAEARGIGVLRRTSVDGYKWELQRSFVAYAQPSGEDTRLIAEWGLTSDGPADIAYEFLMHSQAGPTTSLWEMLASLVLDSTLSKAVLSKLTNTRGVSPTHIPYATADSLEESSYQVLRALGYSSGSVPLDQLCLAEQRRCGLLVQTEQPQPRMRSGRRLLGRIDFATLRIVLYAQADPNPQRERFTLAHELAHHFLGHGNYLVRDACDERDISPEMSYRLANKHIARMEWQANYFAAALLMPRPEVHRLFSRMMRSLGVVNRGFGHLFVDDQSCNVRSYNAVIARLSQEFGTSRAATAVRLRELNLLTDARKLPTRVSF